MQKNLSLSCIYKKKAVPLRQNLLQYEKMHTILHHRLRFRGPCFVQRDAHYYKRIAVFSKGRYVRNDTNQNDRDV